MTLERFRWLLLHVTMAMGTMFLAFFLVWSAWGMVHWMRAPPEQPAQPVCANRANDLASFNGVECPGGTITTSSVGGHALAICTCGATHDR